MPSVIDPNVLVDDQPVAKAAIRNTFAVIKQELEHGGFATIAGGAELRVAEALAGRWVDVRAFGATTDDTDCTAALQDALDSNLPLYFPPGIYRITAPLKLTTSVRMRGCGWNSTGGFHSEIRGDFGFPLIYTEGYLIAPDNTQQFAPGDTTTPIVGGGTGRDLQIQDMRFTNTHIDGGCIQTYNTGGSAFIRCGFNFHYQGLVMTQGFDAVVLNCDFNGLHFTTRTLADDKWQFAYGLYAPGHTHIAGIGARGCGTAIQIAGPEVNVFSARIEVCGYGIVGGTDFLYSRVGFGTVGAHTRAVVSGISFESNYRSLHLKHGYANAYEGIGIQGGTNGVGPGGIADFGALFEGGSEDTSSIRNITCSGAFARWPIYVAGNHEINGIEGGWSGADHSMAITPYLGASTHPFGKAQGGWHLSRYPANPHAPGTPTITTSSDLHLRGLKGLNLLDKLQPNNLGGIAPVTAAATTHPVAFRSNLSGGSAAFNGDPVAGGSGGALAAGTYFYAHTLLAPRGETGAGTSDWSLGANYKSVTVAAGQTVTLTAFGTGSYPVKHRWYRGSAPAGQFDGFYETDAATYTDTGAPFDGHGAPPMLTAVPSLHEPDANYGIVALPSWDTRVWVTDKATTGFTLNFSTPAPAGATVQWLLFRP